MKGVNFTRFVKRTCEIGQVWILVLMLTINSHIFYTKVYYIDSLILTIIKKLSEITYDDIKIR